MHFKDGILLRENCYSRIGGRVDGIKILEKLLLVFDVERRKVFIGLCHNVVVV